MTRTVVTKEKKEQIPRLFRIWKEITGQDLLFDPENAKLTTGGKVNRYHKK